MNNTVRFQSDQFNHTEPRPHYVNPTCYGDDVAEFLRAKLQTAGFEVGASVGEDWGWLLECRVGEVVHSLAIGFVEGEGWQIIIERPRSLVSSLFGREAQPDSQLPQAVHAALSGEPYVREIKWLAMDRRGREGPVSPRP
jgi:hypothetical protein